LEKIRIEKEVQQDELEKEQEKKVNKRTMGEVISFTMTTDNCHEVSDTHIKYTSNESSEDEEEEERNNFEEDEDEKKEAESFKTFLDKHKVQKN